MNPRPICQCPAFLKVPEPPAPHLWSRTPIIHFTNPTVACSISLLLPRVSHNTEMLWKRFAACRTAHRLKGHPRRYPNDLVMVFHEGKVKSLLSLTDCIAHNPQAADPLCSCSTGGNGQVAGEMNLCSAGALAAEDMLHVLDSWP